MDRKTKKDSFYLYKAYWSRVPFVHLCGARFADRTGDRLTVKVYSNLPQVTLTLDGTVSRTLRGDKVFVFDDLPFTDGQHTVTVTAGQCADSARFTRVAEANPAYLCPDAAGGDTVANWFEGKDTTATEMTFDAAYFSVRDKIGDILANEAAAETLMGAFSALVGMKLERAMFESMAEKSLADMEQMLTMFARPNAMALLNMELQKVRK